MFKIILFSILILFASYFKSYANTKLYIKTIVNNEIITNYDIEKEGNYLKKLNPDLSKIEEKKIFKIANDSLINEKIKKGEIIKHFNLDEDNQIIEEVLKDFYTRLNFKNKDDFINSLKNKDEYKINEIKEKLKIEMLWNKLIYIKYKSQVNINEANLMKKIEKFQNTEKKEYLISEIVFKKNKDQNIDEKINQIKSSIKEIGFSNTANLYSISETSKYGGQIGWVDLSNFSELIQNSLKNKKEGELTDIIKVRNNFIIIRVEKIKIENNQINKKTELDKLVKFETNRQLNQFSKIYFDKSKINYSINEK